MITIRLIDDGCERYIQNSDCTCLGRRWDNIAEKVQVVRPNGEENNVCAMIILYDNEIIDHIIVGEEPIDITSNASQYPNIQIGFSFSNETGYIKNSEVVDYYFADAIKPIDFVPMPPTQEENLNNLIGKSFVRSEIVDNIIKFYNIVGDLVSSVDLSGFGGGSSGVPTKLSELENDTNFINNTVDNLVNYYKKGETYTQQEIDNKLSVIPKFAVEVVTSLPTSNISNTTIYLLKVNSNTDNLYEEYIRVDNAWELLGTARIDLTNYLQRADIEDSDSIVHSFTGNQLKFELSATIQNKIAKSLVTPMSRPTATELVAVDNTGSQTMIEIGDGLSLENGVLNSTATGTGIDSDTLEQIQLDAHKQIILGADGVLDGDRYNFEVKNPESILAYRTNNTKFLLDFNLPIVGDLDNSKEFVITFGDTVYYGYNILKGQEHSTIGELHQVDKYNNATGYRFITEATFFKNDEIEGFAIIPTISMSDILSLNSDQMDNYLADGGLTQGQLAICNKVITNGYSVGSLYRFDIIYPNTYSWTQLSYSKTEIDTLIGNIETLLSEV